MIRNEKETNRFLTFNYNNSKKEIEEKTKYLTEKELRSIELEIKNYLQEILANLLGCHKFFDAIITDTPTYNNYILKNQRIGKKKLTELFAWIIACEKKGYYLDQITFPENRNDEILKEQKKKPNKEDYYYLPYLEFNNLNEFLNQIKKILKNNFFFRNHSILNTYQNLHIPDPNTFDYQNYYYETIDTTKLLGEERKIQQPKGIEVNAITWINNFQNRFSLAITKEHSMWEEELTKIKEAEAKQETEKKKRKAENQQEKANTLPQNSEPKKKSVPNNIAYQVSEKDILEEKKGILIHLKALLEKKKKCLNKKVMLPIAGLILLLSAAKFKDLMEEKNQKTIENTLPSQDKNQDIIDRNLLKEINKLLNEQQTTEIIESTKENIPQTIPDHSQNEEETEQLTFTNLGNIIQVEGKVPYYTNSTSNKATGTKKVNGYITGYFATIQSGNTYQLIKSCRNQEEMMNFLENCPYDPNDIIWKCSICEKKDVNIEEYLKSEKDIPYTLTTYFIDYEPTKEKTRTKGGK